jgi:hypothetical protein
VESALLDQLARTLVTAGLKSLSTTGEDAAEAVGRELARRARAKPADRRYRVLPAELVDRALTGEATAARELVKLKFKASVVDEPVDRDGTGGEEAA